MDWLALQPSSIPVLTQLATALVILIYLLTLRRKTQATWLLILTFFGFTGYLASLCLQLSVLAPWQFIFLPLQYIFGPLTLVALIRFAYVFLEETFRREARIVVQALTLAFVLVAAYVIQGMIRERSSFRLPFEALLVFVLGLGIWAIVVFVRKAATLSATPGMPFWRRLWRPGSRAARAHRSFALVFTFIVLTAVAAMLREAGWLTWAQSNAIATTCFLLYFFGFVLVYVNHAPQPTTFLVKLVGLSLVTVLAALSMVSLGVFDEPIMSQALRAQLALTPQAFDDAAEQLRYWHGVHETVLPMAKAIVGTLVFILLAFPIFFYHSLLKRLNALLEGVRAINAGDLDTQVVVEVNDEIGLLSENLNRMTRSLTAQFAKVKMLSNRMIEQERRSREIEFQRRLLEVENERKTQELEEARQLQLSMLPHEVPQYPHAEIAARMRTATEVGGDYYDFNLNHDGTLTIAIGDATGHGMRAGAMVTATKSLFHSMASEPSIVQMLRKSNYALKRMNLPKLYMAFALAKLRGNVLELAGAGLPPALIYRKASHAVEQVPLKGMPLGSFVDFPYEKTTRTLEAGDAVLLMSDGFPERFNDDGQMLGYERMPGLFLETAGAPAHAVIDYLVQEGERWAGGRPQDDDITFVVLKMT